MMFEEKVKEGKKSAKKMIKIGYVCYKKINFAKEQEKFKEFIEKVTHMNGLYLTSCDLCNCIVRIELILNYEKMMKKFVICGDKDDEIKEEKEEDNNSIDEGKNNNENKNKKKKKIKKKKIKKRKKKKRKKKKKKKKKERKKEKKNMNKVALIKQKKILKN